jgi:hypothetical protein
MAKVKGCIAAGAGSEYGRLSALDEEFELAKH